MNDKLGPNSSHNFTSEARGELVKKIAGRISGINYDDLTTAERQITDLLIKAKYLRLDENDDVQYHDWRDPE